VRTTCLRGHSQRFPRIFAAFAHPKRLVCTNCHLIHITTQGDRAATVTRKTQGLPFVYYWSIRMSSAIFRCPFTHRVDEGFMSCTRLYNPMAPLLPVGRMAAQPRMQARQRKRRAVG